MFPLTTRILIVEDMNMMRKLIEGVLRNLGFTAITTVEDGIKGWQALSQTKPGFELIISDWMMPGPSGLDLLKRVRADSRFDKTPFYLLTAKSEKEQIMEAMKVGVSGYIMKPPTRATLEAQLLKEGA